MSSPNFPLREMNEKLVEAGENAMDERDFHLKRFRYREEVRDLAR